MILVTGASGYLGQRLCREWSGDVIGVSRRRPTASMDWRSLDLADDVATRRMLDDLRPEAVVHCAAAQAGSTETELADVNVGASGVLAAWCRSTGARMVMVSSDMVHGGTAGPYSDDAAPTPLTSYGRSKAEGEYCVAVAEPQAAIVRTSLIYGLDEMDRGTSGMAARLAAGESLTLWSDVVRQPMEIMALANALGWLVERDDVAGVINIAGRDAVSRADFALAMLAHWGIPVDPDQVSLVGLGHQALVPLDLRLDCVRARALGIAMPGVGEICGPVG